MLKDVPNEGGMGVADEVANEMSTAGYTPTPTKFHLLKRLNCTPQCVDAKLYSHYLPGGHLVLA